MYYNSMLTDDEESGGSTSDTVSGDVVDAGTVSPWDAEEDDSGTVDLSGGSTGSDLLDAYDGDDSDDGGSTTLDLTTTSDDNGNTSDHVSTGRVDEGLTNLDPNDDGDSANDSWNATDNGDSPDGIDPDNVNTAEGTNNWQAMLAQQQTAYEARIEALMNDLPIPESLGGSSGGGGLSPALGAVALLAVGGGALYYSEAS